MEQQEQQQEEQTEKEGEQGEKQPGGGAGAAEGSTSRSTCIITIMDAYHVQLEVNDFNKPISSTAIDDCAIPYAMQHYPTLL